MSSVVRTLFTGYGAADPLEESISAVRGTSIISSKMEKPAIKNLASIYKANVLTFSCRCVARGIDGFNRIAVARLTALKGRLLMNPVVDSYCITAPLSKLKYPSSHSMQSLPTTCGLHWQAPVTPSHMGMYVSMSRSVPIG